MTGKNRIYVFVAAASIAAQLFGGGEIVVGIGDVCSARSPEVISLGMSYVNAIRKAGGVPLLIGRSADPRDVGAALDHVDALLLAGGVDVEPARYGEEHTPQMGKTSPERDAFEWLLLSEAAKRRMPVFGICRGCQVLNVYYGGTLHQDIPHDYPDSKVVHRRNEGGKTSPGVHEVISEAGSWIAKWGGDKFDATSSHHQSVKAVAPGFRVTARAPDGVVEAIEGENAIGVQFHPEKIIEPRLKDFSQRMFEGIMKWYAERLAAKSVDQSHQFIHQRHPRKLPD